MKPGFFRGMGGIRAVLFVAALAAGLALHLFTRRVVGQLRLESRSLVEFYAGMYAHVAETESSDDLSFIFDQIIQRTNFPLVQTDTLGNPIGWKGLPVAPDDTSRAAEAEVRRILKRLSREVKPIPVRYFNRTLARLYYGDSRLIRQLEWLPYAEAGFVAVFVLIGLFGTAQIKRGEQRSIWVGMAKETAHQLGTPLSSLLGWLEILKSGKAPPAVSVFDEMERDLQRLGRVTQRFSMIGSRPDLKVTPVEPALRETVEYIRRRAPQIGRPVSVEEKYEPVRPFPLNADLFQWAVENMLKNALDAMDKEAGRISVRLGPAGGRRKAFIEIEDNGRGMDKAAAKRAFRPGFSTKKRGWGLGLSLARRIVEEYHGGRLFVADTAPGRGTVMRMEF